jgi:hypothetical protein
MLGEQKTEETTAFSIVRSAPVNPDIDAVIFGYRYLGSLKRYRASRHYGYMRVNLITHKSAEPASTTGPIPVSLMIRPSCGLPGDYQYATNSSQLMYMLRKKTDLRADTLKQFEAELRWSSKAKLLGVNLDDRVLKEIGYFVD